MPSYSHACEPEAKIYNAREPEGPHENRSQARWSLLSFLSIVINDIDRYLVNSKWPPPIQSHRTSELAVLISLIPFSQGKGNGLYILNALSKPLTYLKIIWIFLVKGEDNPHAQMHTLNTSP